MKNENENEAIFILYELKWLINHEFYRTNELIKNKCDILETDELKTRLEILKTMRKHVDNICDKITELQKQ
jgi:hypothetical protein